MIAYKGFRPGMICIDYQFQMGLNVTDKANCRQNGFHCAENPLDCLNYYGDIDHSEYYIVNAGGDIDEDDYKTRSSCTEIVPLRRLSEDEFLLMHAQYVFDHPTESFEDEEKGPFHIAYGKNKSMSGQKGDWLCFIDRESAVAVIGQIDGERVFPEEKYTMERLESALNEKG